MDKNYNHQKFEEKIYHLWEKSGVFSPKTNNLKKPFSIIMPPPNANDPLHVGHAMFVSAEDIFTRYFRMKGYSSLWLPGTDHAGIETQFVFEKKLAKKGKSRFDFDRDSLYKMIWDYVQENSDVAVNQMKRLGASADWSRFKFTLDPDVVKFVTNTFLKLYRDGLIYRGERLVNYCIKCGTGYSELEVEYIERNDPMYYMKYGPFVIATARPETKFRDTAVAVNPKDKKYKDYIGKTIDVMGLLGPVKMTVIPDPEVDPKFGTGIMKVTPAHDHHDFELGQKFNLPLTPIITTEGRMDFSWYLDRPNFNSQPEKYKSRARKYHKLKIAEARKVMVADLKEDNLMKRINEKYVHRIGTCYRCHTVLEPLPLPQFFIKTKPLAKDAIKALDKNETIVLGAGREKILRHWLTNIKDWNISRQIVWGIKIPVWYNIDKNKDMSVSFIDREGNKKSGNIHDFDFDEVIKGLQTVRTSVDSEYVVSENKPDGKFLPETDTFDTWFSSGQWPVVTLKTNKPGDFEYYYPTSVMETGYDILPIWVMRMMLLGIYLTGKSPFKTVYLHGLIRDEQGKKMSKSIGNVINPLDMIDKYGADALRMALVISSTPGQDKNVGETQIRGMRNFSNKIWNASRYIDGLRIDSSKKSADSQFNRQLSQIEKNLTKLMENLKIGLAAEKLYGEFWHWYCDICIEENKQGKISNYALKEGLRRFLLLLHPFAPFVTEAIWQIMFKKNKNDFLVSSPWPSY